jgi:protein-tyrosine phosphatase
MKVLMVCLGNICRSPMAEGILKQKAKKNELDWIIDSAGTSGWHDGESPDPRAIKECAKYGINISEQLSRKLSSEDFQNYDLILAMDKANLSNILSICPVTYYAKVKLVMQFSNGLNQQEIPDPYYDNRFGLVYELLNLSLDNFIEINNTVNV